MSDHIKMSVVDALLALEQIAACDVEVHDEELDGPVLVSMSAEECAAVARRAADQLRLAIKGWQYDV